MFSLTNRPLFFRKITQKSLYFHQRPPKNLTNHPILTLPPILVDKSAIELPLQIFGKIRI
jgi:hypothetical protein